MYIFKQLKVINYDYDDDEDLNTQKKAQSIVDKNGKRPDK